MSVATGRDLERVRDERARRHRVRHRRLHHRRRRRHRLRRRPVQRRLDLSGIASVGLHFGDRLQRQSSFDIGLASGEIASTRRGLRDERPIGIAEGPLPYAEGHIGSARRRVIDRRRDPGYVAVPGGTSVAAQRRLERNEDGSWGHRQPRRRRSTGRWTPAATSHADSATLDRRRLEFGFDANVAAGVSGPRRCSRRCASRHRRRVRRHALDTTVEAGVEPGRRASSSTPAARQGVGSRPRRSLARRCDVGPTSTCPMWRVRPD